jgi:hypothetical protein
MIPKSTHYWVVNRITKEVVSKSSKGDADKLRNKLGKDKFMVEYH